MRRIYSSLRLLIGDGIELPLGKRNDWEAGVVLWRMKFYDNSRLHEESEHLEMRPEKKKGSKLKRSKQNSCLSYRKTRTPIETVFKTQAVITAINDF